MAGHRRLEVSQVGDVTVARFVDRKILEESNIQELGQELFQLVEEESNFAVCEHGPLGKRINIEHDLAIIMHKTVVIIGDIGIGEYKMLGKINSKDGYSQRLGNDQVDHTQCKGASLFALHHRI